MRISDWSSDVCSSDLIQCRRTRVARCRTLMPHLAGDTAERLLVDPAHRDFLGARRLLDLGQARIAATCFDQYFLDVLGIMFQGRRSEEHTSELQSLMRISYAVFCLKIIISQSQHLSTQSLIS